MFDKPQQPNTQSPQDPAEDMFAGTEGVPAPATPPPAAAPSTAPASTAGTQYERMDFGPSAVESGKLKPVTPDSPKDTGLPGENNNIYELKAPVTQSKVFLVVGGILVVAVIAGIGLWFFRAFMMNGGESVPTTTPAPATQQRDAAEEAQTVDSFDFDDFDVAPVVTEGDDTDSLEAGVVADSPTSDVVPPAPVAVEDGLEDSDNDGLSDEEEIDYGTDPNNADSDNDGLSDREELEQWGTDPLNADTDGDTYEDGSEIENGYDPKGAGRLFTIPAAQ